MKNEHNNIGRDYIQHLTNSCIIWEEHLVTSSDMVYFLSQHSIAWSGWESQRRIGSLAKALVYGVIKCGQALLNFSVLAQGLDIHGRFVGVNIRSGGSQFTV